MSKSDFRESVERFIDGSLDAEDISLLSSVSADPEIAKELVSQRTIDQLLLLVSNEDRSNQFIEQCLSQFNIEYSTEPSHELKTRVAKTDRRLPRYAAIVASIAFFCATGWWLSSFDQQDNHFNNERDIAEAPEDVSTKLPASSIASDHEPDASLPAEPTAVLPHSSPNIKNELVEILADDESIESSRTKPATKMAVADPIETPPPNLNVDPVPVFGRIISSRNASWSDSPADLRPGIYRLEQGSARLKFDSGALLRIAGPTEIEIAEVDLIRIVHGECLLDVPQKAGAFECQIGYHSLTDTDNASFFLKVDSNLNWESLVNRGALKLSRFGQPDSPISLEKNGINQVAASIHNADSGIPATLIARGNQTFLGQCFDEERSVQFDSANKFQSFLSNVVDNRNVGWKRFADDLDSFNAKLRKAAPIPNDQQFQQLLREHLDRLIQNSFQIQSDKNSTGTTYFRGSLNINGVEQHFDSLEEFNRARQKMLNGQSELLPIERQPKNEDSMFSIGNRHFGFSSAETFQQLRRKMNR